MTIDYKKASQICNANEFLLVQSSRPNHLAGLDLPEVKRRTGRVRTLADKWRERVIEQERSASGKLKPGVGERTVAKRDLFDEVLRRFGARLKKLEQGESAPTKASASAPSKSKASAKTPKTPKAPAKGKKPSTAKKAVPAPEASTAPGRNARSKSRARITEHRVTQSGLNSRIRGHVSASGKRNQARRNKR
jgi:hypothetical protein